MSESVQQWSVFILATTLFYGVGPNNLAKYLTKTQNETIEALTKAGAKIVGTETHSSSCASEHRHGLSETIVIKYESPKPIEVSISPYIDSE